MQIKFRKIAVNDLPTIFTWLDEPHVKEFWDNSEAHREDIRIFSAGRIEKSTYFSGIFDYWLGLAEDVPFAFFLSSIYQPEERLSALHNKHLSEHGNTYGIDFCIGNIDYLGKGLAATTLDKFAHFIKNNVDPLADTFFIDPDINNPRAIHVYQKAGFSSQETFSVEEGHFKNHESILMVKKINR